jgi:prolyl-tRNA editing enzyme YbaK/EbsC (Cys-tRNA(Pro) deacylase)
MATTKNSGKKVTKMSRTQLNEMINYQIDQKVCNYIVETQGITLKKASAQLNESAKDGFKALKQSCKNQAVKAAIFTATKSLQGAVKLLDGEAKTDMMSMVNVLMALTADQTGNNSFAYTNGIQNQQQG